MYLKKADEKDFKNYLNFQKMCDLFEKNFKLKKYY